MSHDHSVDADAMLIKAYQHPEGSIQRAEYLKAADIHATLSLRDAVLEWASTLRHVSGERVERNGSG